MEVEEGKFSPEVCALWEKGEAHGVLGMEGSTQKKNGELCLWGLTSWQAFMIAGGTRVTEE